MSKGGKYTVDIHVFIFLRFTFVAQKYKKELTDLSACFIWDFLFTSTVCFRAFL